jgi:hypothetical protein
VPLIFPSFMSISLFTVEVPDHMAWQNQQCGQERFGTWRSKIELLRIS